MNQHISVNLERFNVKEIESRWVHYSPRFFCSMDNSQKRKVNTLNWNHVRRITKFQNILIPKGERMRGINYVWFSELQSYICGWTKDVLQTVERRRNCFQLGINTALCTHQNLYKAGTLFSCHRKRIQGVDRDYCHLYKRVILYKRKWLQNIYFNLL